MNVLTQDPGLSASRGSQWTFLRTLILRRDSGGDADTGKVSTSTK